MRMLIVPENNQTLKMIKSVSNNNYNIETAENGFSAALMYIKSYNEQKPFSFICLQHEMAVMAGHDALLMIRKFERKQLRGVPFCNACIMVHRNEVQKLYRERGLIDTYIHFLNKPLEVSSLLNMLYKFQVNACYQPIL